CTGNICGFDEPRWFEGKSAIFSAGLRDMDAILGRDDRLIEKIGDAAKHIDADFAALIGTPVPAVIGTDFRALKRMAGKQTGLPILTVECTGTRLYDEGASKAYLELFKSFAEDLKYNREKAVAELCVEKTGCFSKTLGVLGCTPLDISRTEIDASLNEYLDNNDYSNVWYYGMGAGLDEIRQAGTVEKNLVVAPSGLAAAKYLQERFGTPYEVGYPLLSEEFKAKLAGLSGKRILIVHQQVAAGEIREIVAGGKPDENIVCGTWFMQIPELAGEQDVHFEQEDEFVDFVEQGNFDVVIADARFRRALRGYSGEFIDCPHFAVSGTLHL
ncbi:MAG: nitrogenase molybdenum-iron protein, partial [Clostridiales bacterium]|nr:nitrogenase molybdenum-iron protein [Clostridiales bacterium]